MMRKLLLTSVAAALCCGASAQTFSGGDGTADNPYLIKTVADLNELATVVADDNTLTAKLLRLDNDITLSASDASPMIGYTATTSPKKFDGTFDGNGHKISGLNFSAEKSYCGLFASVTANGVIKNLTLEKPTMSSSASYGGFIAAATEGTIENCHVVNGSLTTTAGSYKGGVVGQSKGLVKGCSYSGTIEAAVNAGGVVGQNYGQVEECQSSATIVSTAPNASNVQFGGITGVTIKLNTDPHIYDCYFTGHIEGALANNVGGITGTLSGCEMLRCWNNGYISATGSTGGLTNTIEKGAAIKDCYNTGTVYNVSSTSVGGLIGTVSTDKSAMTVESSLNLGPMFTSITARHDGAEIAGANFAALTVVNCWFDAQMACAGGISYAKTTRQLTTATALEGFDSSTWRFADGVYPMLASLAANDQAILAATPIYLADGETSTKVMSDFSVGTLNDVEWEISPASSAARLNGSSVAVTRSATKADVVFHAYLGDYERRVLVTVYPTLFEENGTADDPYRIETAADMMTLSSASNDQGLDFTGEHFLVTADIDMSGVDYIPVAFASSGLAFNGTFDGGGHSIKNLSLDSRTNQVLNAALFSTVYADGVVKNLTIDSSCKFDAYRNFAPFVATLYGTIENCRNYADIPTTHGYSGGIAYLAYGNPRIVGCYNEGNLSASEANGAMAGIVYTNQGVVENCQNSGNITATAEKSTLVAGIVATNNGSIKNVLNTGRIVAGAKVGGIVADAKAGSSVTNALSLGQVKAFTSRDNLGSVVGSSTNATFSNAYYDSQVVMYADEVEGVVGMPTSTLASDAATVVIADEAWLTAAGRYPLLKAYADETASQLASMPVWFADGMRCDQLTADATLASIDGLTWTLKQATTFKIDGDKLRVTNTEKFETDTLIATYGGYSRMVEISALAILFTGEGTEANPYLINTADDLKKLSDDIASSGLEYAGKYFKVTADLDFTDMAFSPIAANGAAEFKGILDGNGKTIKGLAITTEVDGTGLFGHVGAGGVVKNLIIDAASTISGKSSVGAFAGVLDGTIDNCINYATVSATASTANLGGLAGLAQGTAAITNSANHGSVASAKAQTGGIVGYANGSDIKLTNLTNTADITGGNKTGGIAGYIVNATVEGAVNTGVITGGTDVAGIVGYGKSASSVSNARNLANVNGATEVAGIVGYVYTDFEIADSYNVGDITATASAAGGIAGRGNQPIISRCFNAGNVANTKTSLGSSTPGAGGLVGRGDAIITDAYNVGAVSGEKNTGGLIGYYYMSSKTAQLTRVYQAGSLSSTIEEPSYFDVFIGRPGKATYDAAYYDAQVVHNLASENGTGLTTTALTATAMGGDAWSAPAADGTLPMLARFANDDYARLYAAAICLAEGDTYANVTSPFVVSTANGVVWSGDDVFTIDGGKVTMRPSTVGDYTLTATLGDISRTITLTLNTPATSAIYSIAADIDPANCEIYSLQGVRLNGIPASGIYIVRDAHGTRKVRIAK